MSASIEEALAAARRTLAQDVEECRTQLAAAARERDAADQRSLAEYTAAKERAVARPRADDDDEDDNGGSLLEPAY